MRTLLIASAALLSLSGFAAAQEAPALIYSDSYSQNVQNAGAGAMNPSMTVSSQRNASLPLQTAGQSAYDIRTNENYSGR